MSEQIIVKQDTSITVTVHDNQAVMHFSEPRAYLALSNAEPYMLAARLMTAGVEARPETAQAAIATAMALIDAVYELRGDMKPAGGAVKHELIERHRKTLVNRLTIILNDKREKFTTSNRGLSKSLVEVMLNEVFA